MYVRRAKFCPKDISQPSLTKCHSLFNTKLKQAQIIDFCLKKKSPVGRAGYKNLLLLSFVVLRARSLRDVLLFRRNPIHLHRKTYIPYICSAFHSFIHPFVHLFIHTTPPTSARSHLQSSPSGRHLLRCSPPLVETSHC